MLRAAQRAVEQVNARGGVRGGRAGGGRPLKLKVADDSGSENVAMRVAEQLYADPAVMAVVGHLSSDPSKAAARVYGSGVTPLVMVSPSASNPDLGGINPYFFRICPSDLQHGTELARFAWQTLAARHAGIIYLNNDYGRGVRRTFTAEFTRLGGVVVEADPAVPETRSLEPYLSRMRQGGADVMVLATARAGARPQGNPRRSRSGWPRETPVRGSDGDRDLRRQRGRPRQAGHDRGDPVWAARHGERALMRLVFDTIRSRIVAGLMPLLIGLVGTALLGAVTLRQMRQAVAEELAGLRASSDVGSGLVATVLEEIRAAEQYLAAPSADARKLFQAASDEASQYEKRLEAFGVTGEDRIAVNRLKHLHASIQVDYSIAHALKDLGRDHEALTQLAAVRADAAEVTRLARDFSSRQAAKAAQAADRLTAASKEREKGLWLLLAAIAVIALLLARWALLSIQGPLSRLVTAAERFGGGDLRPGTGGAMPRELRVLAEAVQRLASRPP